MQKKKGRPTSIPKSFYDYDFTKELKKASSSKIKMKLLALKQLQSGAYYYEFDDKIVNRNLIFFNFG